MRQLAVVIALSLPCAPALAAKKGKAASSPAKKAKPDAAPEPAAPPAETKPPATPAPTATPAPAPAPTPAPAVTPSETPAPAPPKPAVTASRGGTKGGATLGDGKAIYAGLAGGLPTYNGGGYGGVEAAIVFGAGVIDVGVAVRFSAYPVGFAAGAQARYHVFGDGALHLALELGVFVPAYFSYSFVGPLPRGFGATTVGLSLEPGVLLSYFVNDSLEVIAGLVVPVAPLFLPIASAYAAFNLRAGIVYGLSSSLGLVVYVEGGPGLTAVPALAHVTPVGQAMLHLGVQYAL
jgi:hypothetical protein